MMKFAINEGGIGHYLAATCVRVWSEYLNFNAGNMVKEKVK